VRTACKQCTGIHYSVLAGDKGTNMTHFGRFQLAVKISLRVDMIVPWNTWLPLEH